MRITFKKYGEQEISLDCDKYEFDEESRTLHLTIGLFNMHIDDVEYINDVDNEAEDLSELIAELKNIRWSIGSTSMDYWSSEGKEAKTLDKVIAILENM